MKKYKIIANKNQLESIGINYDLTGLIGIRTQTHSITDWYELEVEHTIGNHKFTNKFDFPKKFLKEIE